MESCVSIATETEDTARLFRKIHEDLQSRYFRFNVEQGLQGIGLDKWIYMDLMDAATQDFWTTSPMSWVAVPQTLANFG